MSLTSQELGQLEEEGYLFFPDRFSAEEVRVLRAAAADVYAMEREEVWRESSGVPRTAFAAHTYHEAFRRLGRHPRLLEPVEQIIGSPLYMHQFKVNAKVPFDGEIWQWHQDFPTYFHDDAMPEPRLVNALVFIDEVREFNGPLMLVPASHKAPAYETAVDDTTTSYPLRAADEAVVGRLVSERGIEAPKGGPGSVIFAHTNIVHGSGPNMSPWPRTLASITYNAIDNKHGRSRRPDWVVRRDFEVLEPVTSPI